MRHAVGCTTDLVFELGDILRLITARTSSSAETTAENKLYAQNTAHPNDQAGKDLNEAMFHFEVSVKNWVAKVKVTNRTVLARLLLTNQQTTVDFREVQDASGPMVLFVPLMRKQRMMRELIGLKTFVVAPLLIVGFATMAYRLESRLVFIAGWVVLEILSRTHPYMWNRIEILEARAFSVGRHILSSSRLKHPLEIKEAIATAETLRRAISTLVPYAKCF